MIKVKLLKNVISRNKSESVTLCKEINMPSPPWPGLLISFPAESPELLHSEVIASDVITYSSKDEAYTAHTENDILKKGSSFFDVEHVWMDLGWNVISIKETA
jgi:hypothetical protein